LSVDQALTPGERRPTLDDETLGSSRRFNESFSLRTVEI